MPGLSELFLFGFVIIGVIVIVIAGLGAPSSPESQGRVMWWAFACWFLGLPTLLLVTNYILNASSRAQAELTAQRYKELCAQETGATVYRTVTGVDTVRVNVAKELPNIFFFGHSPEHAFLGLEGGRYGDYKRLLQAKDEGTAPIQIDVHAIRFVRPGTNYFWISGAQIDIWETATNQLLGRKVDFSFVPNLTSWSKNCAGENFGDAVMSFIRGVAIPLPSVAITTLVVPAEIHAERSVTARLIQSVVRYDSPKRAIAPQVRLHSVGGTLGQTTGPLVFHLIHLAEGRDIRLEVVMRAGSRPVAAAMDRSSVVGVLSLDEYAPGPPTLVLFRFNLAGLLEEAGQVRWPPSGAWTARGHGDGTALEVLPGKYRLSLIDLKDGVPTERTVEIPRAGLRLAGKGLALQVSRK